MADNIIPKIIHYCWFGGNSLPELAQKCIASWKKYCPNYQIIEWNESNFDINLSEYTKGAYKEKKWAFVSDYARFWILYQFGGIYMDTDVELIKPIDDLIRKGAYMGCEPVLQDTKENDRLAGLKYFVNPGLGIAAPAHNPFYKKVLECYNARNFYNAMGEIDLTTVVHTTTILLKKYGYGDSCKPERIFDIIIYPVDYFCPMNYFTGEIHMTSNTRSIHHYTASWHSEEERKQMKLLQKFNLLFGKRIGHRIWRVYTLPSRVKHKIQILGLNGTVHFALEKLRNRG